MTPMLITVPVVRAVRGLAHSKKRGGQYRLATGTITSLRRPSKSVDRVKPKSIIRLVTWLPRDVSNLGALTCTPGILCGYLPYRSVAASTFGQSLKIV